MLLKRWRRACRGVGWVRHRWQIGRRSSCSQPWVTAEHESAWPGLSVPSSHQTKLKRGRPGAAGSATLEANLPRCWACDRYRLCEIGEWVVQHPALSRDDRLFGCVLQRSAGLVTAGAHMYVSNMYCILTMLAPFSMLRTLRYPTYTNIPRLDTIPRTTPTVPTFNLQPPTSPFSNQKTYSQASTIFAALQIHTHQAAYNVITRDRCTCAERMAPWFWNTSPRPSATTTMASPTSSPTGP